jgi:protein SCO1
VFKRWWPTLVLVLCAASLAGFSWFELNRSTAKGFHGTALDTPVLVGDFALSSAGGKAALSDWRGKYLLVFFGFTECPDVCPLTMGRLAKIYRDLGEPEDVQVVMVSVDPETDTPARVQRYVESFHPSFVGLTGSTSDIAEAARTFFVGYRQLGEGVGHTDYVTLLDREGKMRLVYAQDKMPRLAEDLGAVLKRGRL